MTTQSGAKGMDARRRVLVVDDVADVTDMLLGLLDSGGYDAAGVTDPREAVRVALEFRPDTALIDIGMPHINGYELAPMLREALAPQRLWMVAVTAWGSERDREHSKAVGFDAHLVKPVGAEMLLTTLAKFIVR